MPRGLLLGMILCIGLPLPAAADTTKVLSADSSNHFEVRPSLIGYTGDSSGYFGKRTWGGKRGYVKWTSWTPNRAQAVGTVWVKTCSPTCSDGSWRMRKGSADLWAPKNGRFTRMTIDYKTPSGRILSDARKLGRIPSSDFSDGYWIWRIVGA